MQEKMTKKNILDRIPPFSLLLTLVILMVIGAALIPLVDVGSSPRPRQGKTLTISYGWRNASPKVVEQEVTSKIEGLVSAVKGVAEVSSVSNFGSGRVTVVLKKEADVSAVKFEISSLLKQVRKKLPEDVSYPTLSGGEVVNESDGTRENTLRHLLTYQVNSNLADEQIKEYVQKNVEPVVRAWDEVKRVDVTGGTSQYLEITCDPLVVANYGLTVDDVAEGIRSFIGKSDIVGDVMETGEDGEERRITLYLKTSRFARQIGEMPLKTVDGKIIYLNDLATFEYKDRLPDSYYRVNGLNTIYMNILVDADANEIELSRQLRDKIEELKPRLRDGVYLTLTHDGAKDKQSELEKLVSRTLLSLAILLVFVYLVRMSWKYLSIIAVTLAANILIAVMAYYVFDMRLHTFSLAGITVSLGLIIDAAIVMVDHYSYYRNRKAFLAILAALLTTIGSLVVVFFMPEYIQRDLYDFSWIIIINLSVALFVALLFVPPLVQQFRYSSRMPVRSRGRSRLVVGWARFYRRYIAFTQRRKWVYYVLLVLAFGIPFHALPDQWDGQRPYYYESEADSRPWYERAYNATFGSRFFQMELKEPLAKVFGGTMRLFAGSLDENTYAEEEEEMRLFVRAQMPLGGTVQELNEKVQILENFLVGFDGIKRFETRVERWGATVTVEFKDEYRDTSFPYILESKVIGKVISIGGADWSTHGVSERGFSNSLNLQYRSNRIEIAGYNYNALYRYAEEICARLKQNHRVMDIIIETPGHERQEDELYMVYTPENFALYGLHPAAMHGALRELLSGVELEEPYEDEFVRTDVCLRSLQADRFNVWDLEHTHVKTADGDVWLPPFMDMDWREAKNSIPKKNQEYVLRVAFNVLGSYNYTSNFIKEVTDEFNERFPVGYRCLNDTPHWYQDEGTQYWLILLIVVIIYFLCAILFESLRQPLVIITLIPVSFIGTFLTFYFSGVKFGTGGFASLVLLSGIVVNAGIYIINEYNNQLSARGQRSVRPASLYVKAYNHKIIPVFLTTLSTVLGLVPFLIDGPAEEAFWFSFAIGTSGGLLFSILALIFVMPIFMPLKGTRRPAV